jgi:16S rRNA processing protein RimM
MSTIGPERAAQDLVAIAHIGRPKGVRGECHITALGSTLAELALPAAVLVGREAAFATPMTLTGVWQQGTGCIGRFEGVDDRTAVEGLRNLSVFASMAELPPLSEGEYYHFELEGLRVVAAGRQEPIGIVTGVQSYPTMDAAEVRRPDGSTVLIPLTEGVVEKIDREAGTVAIRPDLLAEIL